MMNARCQIVMDMDIVLVVNVPVYVAIRAHSVKKVSVINIIHPYMQTEERPMLNVKCYGSL
jgi:hypothetical protein